MPLSYSIVHNKYSVTKFGTTEDRCTSFATLLHWENNLESGEGHEVYPSIDESGCLLWSKSKTVRLSDCCHTPSRHLKQHDSNHWRVDWVIATIVQEREELHNLSPEHRHLDSGSR
jgi:Uri superfamily endonuclease